MTHAAEALSEHSTRALPSRLRPKPMLLGPFVALLSACAFLGGDDSGIGGFDRITISQVAALASVDDDGSLTIIEQEPVNGTIAHPELHPAGPVRHLRDPYDYRLERDRVYLMLLTPTIEVQQDSDLGPGQYTVLYLHDPESDLPAGRFPTRGIDPETYLDCIRTNADTTTRFDGLVTAVDAGSDPLWDCIP